MKAVFRCDASIQIGTGHVMRCLTLADALRSEGVDSHFICREHAGHLLELIAQRGYQSYGLPYTDQAQGSDEDVLEHASWLGATQKEDAKRCGEILQILQPDWLIVDHYALDIFWESAMRSYCQKIMVIDDLADRSHDCDILLDQTYGRDKGNYAIWVPEHCQVLCGSKYALLRPEFAQWREYSLDRRKTGCLDHLLINLGGVDKDNMTTEILKGLQESALPEHCKITVIMGSTAPWIKSVKDQASLMRWPTEIKTGVSNIAEIMSNSDLAIGAAGSTSWERCCLGLPTIMLVLAENQKTIANSLEIVSAASVLPLNYTKIGKFSLGFDKELDSLSLVTMSLSARSICDGLGVYRVIEALKQRGSNEY